MRRLTTGKRSEKFVVRPFRRCANVIQCTYTNPDSTVQPTTHHAIRYSLLLLCYKPVQHVIVLNTVGNCNTMVSIVMLYYNLMGPPSYMQSLVDRNVVMRQMAVIRRVFLKKPLRALCRYNPVTRTNKQSYSNLN